MVSLQLPASFNGSDWVPNRQYPIEVIDGQHRLWAFEETAQDSDFQLPVVAFHGLDLSWQAYLFYTINIKPVRINTSLAFDLYPLLRTEDWLERIEGPAVYRETRAQELTQALWATRSSPWFKHINMLGESGLKAMVRQASWIRSLTATYVKTERGTRIGGLFGGGHEKGISRWNGAQQAAFLILVGQKILEAIKDSDYEWAQSLRTEEESDTDVGEPAFYGAHTLLNTDQGVRGLLHITNDLCFVDSEDLGLNEWLSSTEGDSGADSEPAVRRELDVLSTMPIAEFLESLAYELAAFDWRTSAAPGVKESERVIKAAFRGSGGYRELRRQLLLHLADSEGRVGESAVRVCGILDIERESEA